jgi:uncharacterized protein with ParB-like and HNH nuclease domain
MRQTQTSMSISEAYQNYRNNKFVVNRRYQRKLVWSQQEKSYLIESIIRQYPIPLILLDDTSPSYEIIDGLQRLNAIFGFIENQFGVMVDNEEKFFNIDHFAFAQTQINHFIPRKHGPFLPLELAAAFLNYHFPVTKFQIDNSDEVNETFRRINSTGRKLSPQDVRQAGNLSKLSLLVKEIAMEVRGDDSKETLLLQEMPQISIDSKHTMLQYGIKAEDTIWYKQGVLNVSDLKESEDEQFIADIVLSIVLPNPFPASREEFDNYYGNGDIDKTSEVENQLNLRGIENVKNDVKFVFSEILSMTEEHFCGESLKKILNPKAGGNPVKEAFYTLFMAFYELIIIDNKKPFDYKQIKYSIKGLQSRLTTNTHRRTIQNRRKNIATCKGLIQDYFINADATFRSHTPHFIDFQNHIFRSKVESPIYDFKQGFYTLDPQPQRRQFDENSFDRILCNITALSNLGRGKIGYIFVGVTDTNEDTEQVARIDNLTAIPRVYEFGVVGLEREARFRGISLDSYIQFITQKIRSSQLEQNLKTRVLRDMIPLTYLGNTVLIIKVESGSCPVYYRDRLYVRSGANCEEVTGAQTAAVFALFSDPL